MANFCNSVSGSNMKASAMAEELVATAIARGSMDNTTCICVKLGEFVKRQSVSSGIIVTAQRTRALRGLTSFPVGGAVQVRVPSKCLRIRWIHTVRNHPMLYLDSDMRAMNRSIRRCRWGWSYRSFLSPEHYNQRSRSPQSFIQRHI